MAAAYLQHYDGRRPYRRGQRRHEVDPGLAQLIQIGSDPEYLARGHPGQGIAQCGVHDARPRGLPQGLASRIEEGRTIETFCRDELHQPRQPLCLFIRRRGSLPGR